MEFVAFVLGVFLLALTFWDLFETIVVPRPTPGWFRIGRYLVRGSWRVLRGIRTAARAAYDRVLGLFAPAATVACSSRRGSSALIVGYGLILYALRDEIQPVPPNLGTALYFAATSVLTLGFGDIVAVGGPARVVVTIAAISGLGTVALVVTFLFSLYGSYQRREMQVVTLQAAAGAPAVGRRPPRDVRPARPRRAAAGRCFATGSDGRPRSSTRTSRTRSSASSARATTTCPGSARSGRSSTPRASC